MANVVVYVVTSWSNLPSQTSPLDATALNHIETGIKNVTDFINTLNANEGLYLCGAPYTSAEKTKLAGIEAQANKYVLPAATTSALGGVKVDGTTITISNGVISSTASASALTNLTDVQISDVANGQILKYDAQNSKWVNATQEEIRTQLSQLTDVELTDLTDGQIIAWDATEQKWVNVDNSGGGGDVLDYDETLDVLGLPANPLYRYLEIIPIMGSNTVPAGYETSAGTTLSGYDAWKAANGVVGPNDRWGSTAAGSAAAANTYWQIQLPSAKSVSKASINFGGSGISNATFLDFTCKLQGSNDGTTFTDIIELSVTVNEQNKPMEYVFDNPVNLTYFRIQFLSGCFKATNSNNWYDGLNSVQIYEKALA